MTSSILIFLDQNLSFYSLEAGNTELLFKLEKESRSLELAEKFEGIWKKLELKEVQEIYFWTGIGAGFTDTRIIYIWLKSWEIFSKKHFFTLKVENDFKDLIVIELVGESKQNQTHKIHYSGLPRITLKKN